MRQLMLMAALLGATAFGAQAQSAVSFTIKGQLGKLSGPAKVYLRREGTFQGRITDSSTVHKGSFVLRGASLEPVRGRLVLIQNGKRRRLLTGQADNTFIYLEPGTLTITSPDSLAHATLAGGTLNTEHQQLKQLLKPVQAPMDALIRKYYAQTPEQRKTSDILTRLEAQEKITDPAVLAVRTAFIKSHPASLVSLDAVQDAGGAIPSYAVVGPLFETLVPELRATTQGKAYNQQLIALQRVAVGATAPGFSLPTPEGKNINLTDYRGKYVLVDFWASWCGPCRRDNPNLIQYYNEFKARNFEVVGISLDDANARAKWLKAVADDQLPWQQLWSPGGWAEGVAPLYNVRAIPQNFLLDPNGVIVATNLHGAELRATLAKVLPTVP